MLREEKTIGQLAAEYGVHSNMLYRWRDQALVGLPGLFSDQAAQELAHKEAEWEQIWAVPPVKKTASSSASVLPIEKALGEHSDEHALTH
jgi:transposase-like protein